MIEIYKLYRHKKEQHLAYFEKEVNGTITKWQCSMMITEETSYPYISTMTVTADGEEDDYILEEDSRLQGFKHAYILYNILGVILLNHMSSRKESQNVNSNEVLPGQCFKNIKVLKRLENASYAADGGSWKAQKNKLTDRFMFVKVGHKIHIIEVYDGTSLTEQDIQSDMYDFTTHEMTLLRKTIVNLIGSSGLREVTTSVHLLEDMGLLNIQCLDYTNKSKWDSTSIEDVFELRQWVTLWSERIIYEALEFLDHRDVIRICSATDTGSGNRGQNIRCYSDEFSKILSEGFIIQRMELSSLFSWSTNDQDDIFQSSEYVACKKMISRKLMEKVVSRASARHKRADKYFALNPHALVHMKHQVLDVVPLTDLYRYYDDNYVSQYTRLCDLCISNSNRFNS